MRTDPIRSHGGDEAILATFRVLDADHVGAQVSEQGRTVGPRDVAAEIEYANSLEHRSGFVGCAHAPPPGTNEPLNGLDASVLSRNESKG